MTIDNLSGRWLPHPATPSDLVPVDAEAALLAALEDNQSLRAQLADAIPRIATLMAELAALKAKFHRQADHDCPIDEARVAQIRAQGATAERAAIVAWIRRQADVAESRDSGGKAKSLRWQARDIEQGAHLPTDAGATGLCRETTGFGHNFCTKPTGHKGGHNSNGWLDDEGAHLPKCDGGR